MMMSGNFKKFRSGLTHVELMVTVAIAALPVMVVGILMVSATEFWQDTYNFTNNNVKQEALATRIAFGSMGRKANKLNYTIYGINGDGTYTPAVPTGGGSTAYGQAVEFRYWGTDFDPTQDITSYMDIENTGTHYAFFHIHERKLKVDYGLVDQTNDIGAIGPNGMLTTDRLINRQILTSYIDIIADPEIFSHTIVGSGQGCVRMDMIVTDPNDFSGDIEIKMATMLRNVWPQ